MGHIVSCLHILKERIFVFMCILTYFFKFGLYFVFFLPPPKYSPKLFFPKLVFFFPIFFRGRKLFFKTHAFHRVLFMIRIFQPTQTNKRAIKTMMENEVHLVFSRIQHVNPNFEDQYQIQEFEGDGQI